MKNSIQQKRYIEKSNNTIPQKVNILMVDDHLENLLALEAALSSPDYHLVRATSGQKALKHLINQEFAVILLDVQMPGLNGFETAKLIRAREKTKHTPIIFLTAISQESENVQLGYEVGAIDYIFKPFQPDTLKKKIEKFVEIYQKHKEKIYQSEREHILELEKKVEERTLELLSTNERLQQEIAEREKITDDLFASQERFRKIFESSPNLMAIVSLEAGTYIDVNTSWIQFTGYQYNELHEQEMNFQDFIEEASGNRIRLGDHIRNMKIQYKTKGGEMRSGLLSSELIDIEPEPCILFVLTDITERDILEKGLTRLDQLNLIGEMAAGIAHEIRNPMTTVYGFLQIAKNSEVSKDIIELMLDELNRANSIITEFLNLAKNKVSYKKRHQINLIIEALFPLIQAEALRANKQVILDLHTCSDIFIDEKEIRQLILNIALNGLDAMTSGGKLTITTFAKEQNVILKIQDQGTGISPEVMEKIGTPFFTTKDNGTGLGLAICYSIAKRHQAEIEIETGHNGTTFAITFLADH
ncbi:response regulator [Niallia oryzisoli]|uniref:response regulator n=1 Tax=Niallia oryzisoli TaxID=1737571 RepID=UPI00373641B4